MAGQGFNKVKESLFEYFKEQGIDPDSPEARAIVSMTVEGRPTVTKTPEVPTPERKPEPPRMFDDMLMEILNGSTGAGGMDDTVPAVIDGEQPAALSEGEFVLPADVVSLLGDGNSEEGARRLNNFMKQLRQKKTGTKKQPKSIADLINSLE